jgi:hypothetical protein
MGAKAQTRRIACILFAALVGYARQKEATMLKSIEGIYRDGKIELVEAPSNVRDDTRVIVTFLEGGLIDLRARGIDEAHAAELRARLATSSEDWDSPEMAIYDDYDAARAAPQTR